MENTLQRHHCKLDEVVARNGSRSPGTSFLVSEHRNVLKRWPQIRRIQRVYRTLPVTSLLELSEFTLHPLWYYHSALTLGIVDDPNASTTEYTYYTALVLGIGISASRLPRGPTRS
jgi:hypothetical protein